MKIRILLTYLFVFMFIMTAVPVLGEENTDGDNRLIHVSGSGTIKTAPDRCEIDLTVETKNPDVKAAQKENARKMDMVMSALKDSSKGGLSSQEIQTTSYSISEVYYPDDALKAKYGESVTIYSVSNTISIETAQIDRIGDIIDLAVTNGANGVSSLQFTLSPEKTREVRKSALNIAVDKAQSDAQVISTSMGFSLGPVYEVSVDEGYQPPLYYNQDIRTELASKASTSIEPGSVEVSARVSVAYEIV